MYINSESHIFIFYSLSSPDRVRVGVKWGYLRGQLSYCCCGEADSSNVSVFGPPVICQAAAREEVEGAVQGFLHDNGILTAAVIREYHNISLTDLKRVYNVSFYGKSGDTELGIHLSGADDWYGSPKLDITNRDMLLKYAERLCSLAGKRRESPSSNIEFIRFLSICD